MAWRLAPAIAALTVSGCGLAGITVAPVHRGPGLSGSEYDYAAAAGEFATVVVGNPFGGDNATFARRVTTILNEENPLQPTNFTTQPGPKAGTKYRAVFVFNTGRQADHTLCQDPQALRGGPAGTAPITVQAAFCNGAVSLMDVYASASNGDDAKFRALITQVQGSLFPSRSALTFIPN